MGLFSGTMRTKLIHVDELPWWAVSQSEKADMRAKEGFCMYHPDGGWYKKIRVREVKGYSE